METIKKGKIIREIKIKIVNVEINLIIRYQIKIIKNERKDITIGEIKLREIKSENSICIIINIKR
jgi:hypothetical protein